MSIDGNAGDSGRQQPQRQDGSGNNPDLYQWSGRNKQGQQGKPGAGQDGHVVSSENLPDDVVNNWHPDLSLSSDSAKAWYAQSQQQRNKPLQLDQNGDYIVQFGDDLSTIAQRELQNTGQAVNKQSVQAEQAALVAQNDQNFPSLDKNSDLIKTGWKLHIENAQAQQQQPVDNSGNQGDQPQQQSTNDRHRCVPKPHQGADVTPPGYQNKPSVYINNFYGNNNNVYEGGGPNAGDNGQQVTPRNRQCYGDHNGGAGARRGFVPQNGGNGGDLYASDGSGGQQQRRQYNPQQNSGGDLYGFDGSGGRQQNNPQNSGGDLYGFDGSGGNQQNNNRQPYTYNDSQSGNHFSRDRNGNFHVQPNPNRAYSDGWGNNGTTYYPGFNDASQGRQQPTNVYINNFYGNNNNVYEGSGGNPQTRIQQGSSCRQDGSDNYYNNGGGNGNGRYRVQQIPNATAGDSQAIQIPNYQAGEAQYRLIGSNGQQTYQDQSQQTQQVRRQPSSQNQDATYTKQTQPIDDSGQDV